MAEWTDAKIDLLISCNKSIKDPPKKEMREENRHRRNDMTLTGSDGQIFEVFVRQSLEFQEDFSVGLVYLSKEGKRITLVRFNGQHDHTNDPLIAERAHYNFHIHKATPGNLNGGRLEKHPSTITTSYASLNEALHTFLDQVGAQCAKKYFSDIFPLPLFDYGRRVT